MTNVIATGLIAFAAAEVIVLIALIPLRRNQRIYANATPAYHGRRWPVAVGCMA